jgi:hypothetical protein
VRVPWVGSGGTEISFSMKKVLRLVQFFVCQFYEKHTSAVNLFNILNIVHELITYLSIIWESFIKFTSDSSDDMKRMAILFFRFRV